MIRTEDGLLKFSTEHSEMLFESVVNIPDENKKEKLRGAIREALDLDSRDLVIFKQNEIFIKRWGGAPLIHLGLIEKIKEAVNAGSEQKNDITIINDSITIQVSDILSEFGISSSELSQETKEKIRHRLKEQISISSKDVVLFLNDKVVIRRFREQIDEEERIKREQRYNGLPREELEKLKDSIFESRESEAEIVSEIAEIAIERELDFGRITHNYFLKNYIKIFQRNIFEFIRENLSEEELVLEGLANLILRENWIVVHTKIALAILNLVGQKNPNAENFLKNYSGDVEIDSERNKFKLPEIMDKSGSKWTIPSIVAIVMQRQKMLEAIALKQEGINDTKEHIESMYSKIEELNEESVQLEKELAAIEHEGVDKVNTEAAVNAELKELREMLKRCKEEDKRRIQAEISDKTLLLKKLVIKDDALFTRRKRLEHQEKIISTKIEKITFDITKLQKKVKEEEEKMAQFISSQNGVDEKFDSLTQALTMALMKRKIKI